MQKNSSYINTFEPTKKRIDVLDGWRGLSILFVLAAHLLPLGYKYWKLNETAAAFGMALFFTLSGFLITNFLLKNQNVLDFLIRRVFRIVPLVWLYICIVFLFTSTNTNQYLAHIFFYANWPPMQLINLTSHIWSLCVEMQFYLAIAFFVLILKARGLFLLPIISLTVTLYRDYDQVYVAINTYYRVDEILAGSILALIFNKKNFSSYKKFLAWINQYLLIFLLFLSCHPKGYFLNYFRPYFAAMLVGSTLFNNSPNFIYSILNTRSLFYIASISYALYIIHGGLRYTWLGEGDLLDKYLKRPLLFMVLFMLAHLSTFYFEHKCIAFGKAFSLKLQNILFPAVNK
jgi:peptidoglycan/LPS O-acetylase OafA/YrhL